MNRWKKLPYQVHLYQLADLFNPLSANSTKCSNTFKQFVGNLPTNCLSVFDNFVGLAPKGLTHSSHVFRLFRKRPVA